MYITKFSHVVSIFQILWHFQFCRMLTSPPPCKMRWRNTPCKIGLMCIKKLISQNKLLGGPRNGLTSPKIGINVSWVIRQIVGSIFHYIYFFALLWEPKCVKNVFLQQIPHFLIKTTTFYIFGSNKDPKTKMYIKILPIFILNAPRNIYANF